MKFKHIKYTLALTLLISLSACFGRGSDNEQATNENLPQVDMTRPPNTITNIDDREEESNPDETVSFEEWNKKQETDD